MPHESIVGMILYHDSAYTIVNCTDRGIAQHTLSTWQIRGRSCETVEDFKKTSEIFNSAVRKWITEISDEEREFFVSLVFSMLEQGGETFSELMANPRNTLVTLYQSYHGQDKETKKMVRSILRQLIVLSTRSVKENIHKDGNTESA